MQISSIRLTDTRRRKADARRDRRASQVPEPIAVQTRIETLATTKRTAASLTPIPQKTAEPYLHIVIDPAEGRARIPVPEIRRPATQQRIDCGNRGGQRRLRRCRGQAAQFLP